MHYLKLFLSHANIMIIIQKVRATEDVARVSGEGT